MILFSLDLQHTCQPEMTKKTEIFRLGCFIAPAVPRRLHRGKSHNLVLEHVNSQHASIYWNKEAILLLLFSKLNPTITVMKSKQHNIKLLNLIIIKETPMKSRSALLIVDASVGQR